jgi:hypothetical protein
MAVSNGLYAVREFLSVDGVVSDDIARYGQ